MLCGYVDIVKNVSLIRLYAKILERVVVLLEGRTCSKVHIKSIHNTKLSGPFETSSSKTFLDLAD